MTSSSDVFNSTREAGDERWPSPAARLLILLLAGIAPLLPTLRAAFIYDDTTIIRDNAQLRGWSSLLHVWTQPYWPSDGVDALGLYRPLQLALLATVWNAAGGSAFWMHVYALLLDACTILAVWWILRRGVGPLAALVAAAWFAVHPLHVEAIASVANTSELVVVLCVAGMVCLLARVTRPAETPSGTLLPALAVGSLAAAALFAKESGLLALPLAAITAWGWRCERMALREFTRRSARPLFVASGAVVGALCARLIVLGTPVSRSSIAAQGLGALSFHDRVISMMSLWPRITGMLAWPTALSPYYGPTIFPDHRVMLAASGGTIFVAAILLAGVTARRGDPRLLVAFAWVALSYFPASNLVSATGQILADRTLFGATVGAAFALAWVVSKVDTRVRRILVIACILIMARSAIVTARYALAWTSHRALWTRLVETSPREHLGYKLLGMDARARGDTTRALAALERALAMAPGDRQARFEYGQVLYTTKRYSAAALTLEPLMRDADAGSEPDLVALYLDAVGRADGAAAVVAAATRLLHSGAGQTAALFIGLADEQLGKRMEADSAYTHGLRRNPADSLLLARRAALRANRAKP